MSRPVSRYEAGQWRLRECFAPILGHWAILVRFGEVPVEIKTRLAPLFSEIGEAILDDELGLIGATPEQRVARMARD